MKYTMACHIFEDFQDKTLIASVSLHHDLSKTKEKILKNKLKKSATFQILSKLIVNIIFSSCPVMSNRTCLTHCVSQSFPMMEGLWLLFRMHQIL